jgi:nucleotide-binding universal stress UspA family protein
MLLDRILVPLDGSASGEVVLPFLKRLPLRQGARIILAKIVQPGEKDPGPGFIEETLQFTEGYLRELAGTLEKNGIVAETVVRSDRVAEALVALAVEKRATLILMATHGRTASPARPFGGIAEQLIRTSPVPILAVPSLSRAAFGPGAGVRTILVTTDGSDYADAVAPVAADLAAACGSSVVLLELTPTAASESRAVRRQADAEKHLRDLGKLFERRGIPTQQIAARGSPVSGILEEARLREIGLVAMSTHGSARHCDAVVGSVTQAVLQQSGIPVLMTRSCPAPAPPGERRRTAKSRRR